MNYTGTLIVYVFEEEMCSCQKLKGGGKYKDNMAKMKKMKKKEKVKLLRELFHDNENMLNPESKSGKENKLPPKCASNSKVFPQLQQLEVFDACENKENLSSLATKFAVKSVAKKKIQKDIVESRMSPVNDTVFEHALRPNENVLNTSVLIKNCETKFPCVLQVCHGFLCKF